MALLEMIVFMVLAVAIFQLYETPMCGDCGNRFVHAKDCWRRREP